MEDKMDTVKEKLKSSDTPEIILYVLRETKKLTQGVLHLTFEEEFREYPDESYLAYTCNVKFSHIRPNYREVIHEKWGLTIRVYCINPNLNIKTLYLDTSIKENIRFEIFSYPYGLGITTEKGETLSDGLRTYFKLRFKEKIKHYKTRIKELKEKK
jgi:hypothetical protein